MNRVFVVAVVSLLLAANDGLATPSPYSGEQARAIKALSAGEVSGLLAGKGLGLAKAAELNGLPGPLHVLQMGEALGLTAAQKARTQDLYDAMAAAAKLLGARIIAAERALDAQFAAKSVTPEFLTEATAQIGRLQGELRAVHLRAHLDQVALLDASQIEKYGRLRGYGEGGGGHDPNMHGAAE